MPLPLPLTKSDRAYLEISIYDEPVVRKRSAVWCFRDWEIHRVERAWCVTEDDCGTRRVLSSGHRTRREAVMWLYGWLRDAGEIDVVPEP